MSNKNMKILQSPSPRPQCSSMGYHRGDQFQNKDSLVFMQIAIEAKNKLNTQDKVTLMLKSTSE